MYSRVPPPGDNIPVELEPFKVEDEVPEEGEIEWESNTYAITATGGPSRMRA